MVLRECLFATIRYCKICITEKLNIYESSILCALLFSRAGVCHTHIDELQLNYAISRLKSEKENGVVCLESRELFLGFSLNLLSSHSGQAVRYTLYLLSI